MTDIERYMTIYWVIGVVVILIGFIRYGDVLFKDDGEFARWHGLSSKEMLAVNIMAFVLAVLLWPAALYCEAKDLMERRRK
jgi:hypothetical protein